MKKNFLIGVVLLSAAAMGANAAISAGDLAFIGGNTSTTDGLGVVVLKSLSMGDTFSITDNGWQNTGSFRTGEGVLTYTAASAISAGTVLTWTNGQSITGTGWNSNNPSNFALNASGDSLMIYTGTIANPSLVYALGLGASGYTAGWNTTASSASTSAAPTVANGGTLINGTTIVGFNFPNGYYSGAVTSGTQAELLAAISNAANWTTSNSITSQGSWQTSFTVVPEPHEYGIAFGMMLIVAAVIRRRRAQMEA